jgi:hypothetical protein
MSKAHCRFALLLLSASLTAYASPADTATSPHPQPSSSVVLPQTYDQIVRLSLVEGDVRISRGKEGEHATGGAWGQAAAGIPIETGFSLATGKGRAEIEFEDASTVYLGENSVLTFDQLTTTGGVPHTNVVLVSGIATLNVRPEFARESFILRTPIGRITVRYPDVNFIRVNSYLDAMALTPQEDSVLHEGSTENRTIKGQTVTYNIYGQIVPEAPSAQNEFAEWDDWAAKHVAARDLAMSSTMKEAGLASPVPGLAELNGQGTFFDCAPYGTCWQPTNGWGEYEAAPARFDVQSSSDPSQPQSAQPSHPSAKVVQTAANGAVLRTEYEEPFPCSPDRVRRLIARDPITGRDTVLRTDLDPNAAPYDWAVCHTGAWIHRGHRFVWVTGTKRHHHCPVRWVKYGSSKAYVPLHPHDVAGKTPINLKHGVFQTTGRKGASVEHVAFNAGTPVKLLAAAPKEFLKPYFPPLQRAETPHLEAHVVKEGFVASKDGLAKPAGTAITFDHRSGSIMVARQVVEGGKNTTVTEHFGGNSSFQARNGGGNFSNGNSGWRSGGNNSGSFSRSSSNTGGGSHSGGGFSGGGGGFHGGSGGGGGGGGFHGGGGGGGSASSGGGGSHK